ncbi:MAG: hypothetical protein MRY21_02505 [Simkaniaceae bacterium]|nr:hypothetical protein [Simkaniaceae bacterium]
MDVSQATSGPTAGAGAPATVDGTPEIDVRLVEASAMDALQQSQQTRAPHSPSPFKDITKTSLAPIFSGDFERFSKQTFGDQLYDRARADLGHKWTPARAWIRMCATIDLPAITFLQENRETLPPLFRDAKEILEGEMTPEKIYALIDFFQTVDGESLEAFCEVPKLDEQFLAPGEERWEPGQGLFEVETNFRLRMDETKRLISMRKRLDDFRTTTAEMQPIAATEYITKVIVRAKIRPGMLFPVPAPEGKMTLYRLDCGVDHNGWGMFLMRPHLPHNLPEDCEEVLWVGRGTVFADFKRSFYWNYHANPGQGGMELYFHHINNATPPETKNIRILGYSQGGGIGQIALTWLLEDPARAGVEKAVLETWNSPAISIPLRDRFNAAFRARRDTLREAVINHRYLQYDPVSKILSVYLGAGLHDPKLHLSSECYPGWDHGRAAFDKMPDMAPLARKATDAIREYQKKALIYHEQEHLLKNKLLELTDGVLVARERRVSKESTCLPYGYTAKMAAFYGSLPNDIAKIEAALEEVRAKRALLDEKAVEDIRGMGDILRGGFGNLLGEKDLEFLDGAIGGAVQDLERLTSQTATAGERVASGAKLAGRAIIGFLGLPGAIGGALASKLTTAIRGDAKTLAQNKFVLIKPKTCSC